MDFSGIVRGPRLPIEISEDYEPRNAKGMAPWTNRTDSLKSKKFNNWPIQLLTVHFIRSFEVNKIEQVQSITLFADNEDLAFCLYHLPSDVQQLTRSLASLIV